jgi:glutaredoxin-related protein
VISLLRKAVKRFSNELLFKYYMSTSKPKIHIEGVFVIGMPKTATSSTKVFLKSLGFRHLTIFHSVTREWETKNYEFLENVVEHFNSFDDKPWNKLDVIERLMKSDKNYRFILTVRDSNEWFNSVNRYSFAKSATIPYLEKDRKRRIEEFLYHQKQCENWAKTYHKPLLKINVIEDQRAVEKLSDFLGVLSSMKSFPHVNKTSDL